MSEVMVLAGLIPFEDCEGEFVRATGPVAGDLQAVYGIPWPVDASPHSLPSHGLLPRYVSLC